YDQAGMKDRVALFMGPGPHGTPQPTREALNEWMIRWLKDGKGDPRETDVPLYSDRELVVTKSGQVENEPGSRKLHEVIRSEWQRLRQPLGLVELKAELQRLGVNATRPATAAIAWREGQKEIVATQTEPGVRIGGALYAPEGAGRHPAVLVVKDRYSSAIVES